MAVLFLIISSIILSYIFVMIYIRQFGIRKLNSKSHIKLNLNAEEAVKLISKKSGLSAYETEKLELLYSLSNTKLYLALEDEELGRQWLISIRRIVYHNKVFNQETKEDLELIIYEIFRKINNARIENNPSIRFIKDIGIAQEVEIEIVHGPKIKAETLEIDSRNINLIVKDDFYDLIKQHQKYINRKVKVSFWKKMDSGYEFESSIVSIFSENSSHIITLKNTNSIKRTNIREFPRREAEIPVRFRPSKTSTDSESGSLEETYGRLVLGFVSNISTRGCSIVSHFGVQVDTMVSIQLPLFDKTLKIKGIVRQIIHYEAVYLLNIEFLDNISKGDTLMIYHYIFAENHEKN